MCDTPDSFRLRLIKEDSGGDCSGNNDMIDSKEQHSSANEEYEPSSPSETEDKSEEETPSLKQIKPCLGISETDAKPSGSEVTEGEEKTEDNAIKTDSRPFQKLRRQSAVETRSPVVEVRSPVSDRNAEEYNMGHPRRGVALILNHTKFETEAYRKGSDLDCNRLKKHFGALGFEVRIKKNLNYDEVIKTLRDLSVEDHSRSDCLLVAVMTHGTRSELYASDHTYPVERLWSQFTADKCASLAGKPKIFIIQACRGERVDSGTVMADVVDAPSATVRYTIPNQADILVANATADGFYAWRNPEEGSWFIKTFCEELQLHAEKRDLATILTFVSRRVAIECESIVPQNSAMDKKKQVPCIVSMLTRLIYFRKKTVQMEFL